MTWEPLFCARSRNRWGYALAVAGTVMAGLASRRFQVFPDFLGKYPGDALWALMVFFGFGFLFRRAATWRIGLAALAFSFAIEVLKLHPSPWLADLRRTTPGHLVLGHVFGWANFPAYLAGVLAGVGIEVMGSLRKKRTGRGGG